VIGSRPKVSRCAGSWAAQAAALLFRCDLFALLNAPDHWITLAGAATEVYNALAEVGVEHR
jgi:hypothetical protein